MPEKKPIAVYGLGNMGYPIAQRLASRFTVAVSDLNGEQVARAQAEFAAAPCTAAFLFTVHAVVLSLPDPAASMAVLRDIAPTLARGTVVIESSTINPADAIEQRDMLAGHGIDHIDASVLAGVGQMRSIGGQYCAPLCVMAGCRAQSSLPNREHQVLFAERAGTQYLPVVQTLKRRAPNGIAPKNQRRAHHVNTVSLVQTVNSHGLGG